MAQLSPSVCSALDALVKTEPTTRGQSGKYWGRRSNIGIIGSSIATLSAITAVSNSATIPCWASAPSLPRSGSGARSKKSGSTYGRGRNRTFSSLWLIAEVSLSPACRYSRLCLTLPDQGYFGQCQSQLAPNPQLSVLTLSDVAGRPVNRAYGQNHKT